MATQARGKVAGIKPPYELVVNIGRNHGVTNGDILQVLSDERETILDPDDPEGEPLGIVRRALTLVKVAEVSDKISVARTYRQIEVLKDRSPAAMSKVSLFSPPETIWEQETLRQAKDETDKGGIRVGLEVRLVQGASGEGDISRTVIDS